MRSLIFNGFFYSVTFAYAFWLFVLSKLSTQARMQRTVSGWGRTILWGLRWIMNARVEIRGTERIPPQGLELMVSKHQSELDVVMLAIIAPNCGAVAMKELEKYPFFGPILAKLDMVMVAVDQGPQGRTAQAVEGALRIQSQGRPMVIYPEGELMALGAKERYRRGVGHIYQAMGVPAVPVAASLGVIWPKREWRKVAGTVGAIEFLEPIQPGLGVDEFMALLEARIETGTMALIEEHATGAVLDAARGRYARGANNHG